LQSEHNVTELLAELEELKRLRIIILRSRKVLNFIKCLFNHVPAWCKIQESLPSRTLYASPSEAYCEIPVRNWTPAEIKGEFLKVQDELQKTLKP
jgi:hypothetical protein